MAGFAARYRRRDDGAGDLCPAVIYRGAELSLGAFFARTKSFSLEAFAFIFSDPDFYLALKSGLFWPLVWWRLPSPSAGSSPF
jgi:hypothetical protein